MRHWVWRVLLVGLTAIIAGCGSSGSRPAQQAPTAPAKSIQAKSKQAKSKQAKSAAATKKWQPQLSRGQLEESLRLGRKFMLFNQKPAGDFNYRFNFLTAEQDTATAPVRQAGAFWGVALMHQYDPQEQSKEAFLRTADFYHRHSRRRDERRWLAVRGEQVGQTGTVALVALALIDYLRAEGQAAKPALRKTLNQYLNFLMSLRTKEGRFRPRYDLVTEQPSGQPSPYFDGESLLAITKAAKYLGRDDLQAAAVQSAVAMRDAYFRGKLDKDLPETKGFYQWGTMSFFELASTKWRDTDWCGEFVIDGAVWMIQQHRTLNRKRNTGYAYEGIVLAYEMARQTNQPALEKRFAETIDQGMKKLVSWQVGGPLPNQYLQKHSTDDPQWVGGIMNAADDPWLRIDVVQHQMHATMLALRYVYKKAK